jgi:gamma-glutamylcysteine synthetase
MQNMLYSDYAKQQKEAEEANKKVFDELKAVANRLFSTEDGKIYARQMIRACRMLESEGQPLSPEVLQRLQAQKDFVNLFLTKLVDRKVFMSILEEI